MKRNIFTADYDAFWVSGYTSAPTGRAHVGAWEVFSNDIEDVQFGVPIIVRQLTNGRFYIAGRLSKLGRFRTLDEAAREGLRA